MKTIYNISACLILGLLVGCSDDARSHFWNNYDPIGDAIDNSREKSRKKRRVDYYKDRGASNKEAERMAFEDKVWAGGASEYTQQEWDEMKNPHYPGQ